MNKKLNFIIRLVSALVQFHYFCLRILTIAMDRVNTSIPAKEKQPDTKAQLLLLKFAMQ